MRIYLFPRPSRRRFQMAHIPVGKRIRKKFRYQIGDLIKYSRRITEMSKFEKRLVIFALVFVVIYLGAAIVTINTRLNKEDRIERLESTKISPTEGRLLMVELFLPMLIFFTLTICFIVVRKQRAKKMLLLDDEPDEEFEFPPDHPQDEN